MEFSETLSTDLYQLTMAQGYFEHRIHETQACFHMYFRDYPFKGGYAIACGMEQLAQLIEHFHWSARDIDYLRSIPSHSGGTLFHDDFLHFLQTHELTLDIDAVAEGSVVFPDEPLVRVTGSLVDCQLVETALLNCVNFNTLIATKAARVCLAAQTPVAEFGLRRAQGPVGGLWASRAAIVGGCTSTSNVLAGSMYGVPVSGTHAHSWVMSFPTELDAFRAYAQSYPHDCVLLVDTYEVEQGIRNAIIVGLEMKQRGEHLIGIRIDSGDLAWLAKRARTLLDQAGLHDTGVFLSNDLDEYSISSIRAEGACVAGWGVGTRLACAFDQPTLGGVYKLSATRASNQQAWHDHVKITGSAQKLTIPGVLDVRRYIDADGRLAGDMIFDIYKAVNEDEIIIDPHDHLRRKRLHGMRYTTLLKPLARKGSIVLADELRDVHAAQQRTKASLEQLDETQKRMLNPHTYPVGLEKGIFERRSALVAHLLGYE